MNKSQTSYYKKPNISYAPNSCHVKFKNRQNNFLCLGMHQVVKLRKCKELITRKVRTVVTFDEYR